MNHRKPVLDRNVKRAHDLLNRVRVPRAALHAWIVGANDHLTAAHDADADNRARRGGFAVIGHVGRQRRKFEERRAGIEKFFDALARTHLALARQAFKVALWPGVARALLSFAE